MVAVKPLAIIAISIASVALGSLSILAPTHLLNGIFNAASHPQGCNRPPGYVSIILDSSGFNDSKALGAPNRLPTLLQYQQGGTVNLIICNFDPVETHGFAISHYFDVGVTLRPGESHKISFVAKDTGAFTVYCNVLCSVHPLMLGKLVVT
jgi:hypothetical protein